MCINNLNTHYSYQQDIAFYLPKSLTVLIFMEREPGEQLLPGLEKIAIFKKKSKKSDFFDLNRIFLI